MAITKEKMEEIKKAALWNFYNGLNCCESVYEAFLSCGVIPPSDAVYETCALCAGFGGGLGMSGYSCGALSGAILAVGSKHGRKHPKEEKPDGLYDVEYRRYNNMVNEFKDAMGSVIGREICQENLHDWGGKARKDHCAGCIEHGVEIACKYYDMTTEEVGEKLVWRDNVASL